MRRIHFVGIGGIGMSGIAELLLMDGFKISGSDLAGSSITRHLEEVGVVVHKGHDAANVVNADAVVYSSAVNRDNPEVAAAVESGIPVIRRAEMLAELMRLRSGVAIAGTHGKTTTTSLVGHVLTTAGLDPTVVVGGVLRGLGTNARLGKGELLVAEADEYDRSFLKLTPTLAVLTTLEAEHLDTYGSFDNLREAFVHFANSVPFYGLVIVCGDEPNLVDLIPEIHRPVLTYGFSPHVDVRAEEIEVSRRGRCRVNSSGNDLGVIEVPLVGEHNLKNALAAVTVGLQLDVPMERIRKALADFQGVRRRFDFRGEVGGISVYDDYAHHPTEVKATLEAARKAFNGRIVAVFQPHLFTRTRTFSKEFSRELLAADMVVITDIYPAREEPIKGVTGEMIADGTRKFGHKSVHYLPEREKLAAYLAEVVNKNDLVITLGAGDIYRTSEELLALLRKRENK